MSPRNGVIQQVTHTANA